MYLVCGLSGCQYIFVFFFSSRRRHTRLQGDWSSDVCSSDLILFSQRSQFLHKINTLQEMVDNLARDFQVAAEDLGCGVSGHPDTDWESVDCSHYDLNTCLRETIVLLKSFLVILPDDQLGVFQSTVHSRMHAAQRSTRIERLHNHRRMAPIERE